MITLSAGEEIVASGEAKYASTKGVLCCTNKRIAFEYEKGIFLKSKSTPVDIPLSAIASVSVEGMSFLRKLVINIKKGVISGPARYEFNVRDPSQWEARMQMSLSGSSAYNVENSQSNVSTTETKNIQAKRCTNCGQLVEVHMAYCPICGHQLI